MKKRREVVVVVELSADDLALAAAIRELVDAVMRSVSGIDGEPLWESEDEMWEEAIDEPHRSLLRSVLGED